MKFLVGQVASTTYLVVFRLKSIILASLKKTLGENAKSWVLLAQPAT